MEKLTKKQIEEYNQFCYERDHGRLLTPDGLRFICEACNMDPMAIGTHVLECLSHMQTSDNIRN